ncbi:hypothetical protein PHMEG_0002796 [Phytophthora megakarya]|uniref:Uncharacterized protein n=1 Tax=Phytophthora megakarya TaxID=4795 RepID=A0A225WZN4_9STRA|nr:hypothetical protein PHMEG_0002796 [Phytophthora megakarya]
MNVVVVDDHHHCLPDIHLAIRQRRLPFSEIHVLHVDAHPDLSFPAAVDASVIFQPDSLYELLDKSVAGIAEFLLPLVFAGHVNQISWLKPSWATQMPNGAYKQLAIGKRKSNGAMGVTCELPHFVEDELFCPVEDMNTSSMRHWNLFAMETNSSDIVTEAITTARQKSKDLETHIGKADVNIVANVFYCVRYRRDSLEILDAKLRDSERRTFCKLIQRLEAADSQQDNATRRSEWVQVVRELAPLYAKNVNAEKLLDEFAQVLEKYRGDKRIQREIWAAGPFLDLPHHENSLEEIECMVNEVEEFLHLHALDATNPPAIVTIAKSTGDEFLPPHQLDVALTSVLQMLERVFDELSTKYIEYEHAEGGIDEVEIPEPTHYMYM